MRRAKTGLILLGSCLVASLVLADEPKKDAPEDKQVVDSKAVRVPPAASVNFRKELGLNFDSLGTIGTRIDQARRKHDPVALAHAASELNVAEKVSGKKASLTSKQVLKESSELAKLRSQEAELRAVLNVNDQIANEQDVILSLKKEIDLAKQRAEYDTEAIQKNLEPTWQPRKVTVNNYTTQYLTIWVNGRYKTEIPPGQSQVCVIEHRWNPVILTAHGNEDIDTWGPRYIWGRFTKYTWNIN
jgi:hypothetical protein